MSFFGLFKPAAPAVPAVPAVSVPPVPAVLPKIAAPTAAQIATTANPSPEAQAILAANPAQTPSEYLGALQEKQMGNDMVNTMSHGMSDRDGVNWAAKSADQVSDKLPPHEVDATKAAQAWADNPTPENQAAAAAAAAQGGCQGPGSMAAQGAAWAQPETPADPAAAAMPRMTPHAVSGSVLMSAGVQANPALTVPTMTPPTLAAPTLAAPQVALPSVQMPQVPAVPAVPAVPQPPAVVPPAIQAQTFQQQHPFIALGLKIASGKPV